MPTKKTTTSASRRRRHPASAESEDVGLGDKLQAFRRSEGLLQDELARDLGLNQRIISRIETGTRQIQPAELEKFKKVYGVNLESVRVPKTTSATPLAMDDDEYLKVQQELVLRGDTTYALWILNPGSLPMLESNRFTRAWAENLVEGFEYRTVWILDLTQTEDLRRFVARVHEVAAAALDWQGAKGGRVHVHPLILPPASFDNSNAPVHTREAARAIEYYQKLRQTLADAPTAPKMLTLHEAHQLEIAKNLPLLLFLLRFYFEPAYVVAYKPASLLGKQHVVVGLKDIVRHDDPKPMRGFCFLGDASVGQFMSHIDELERLLT